MTETNTAVWKSNTGKETKVSDMPTAYIVNCVNKVETELTESTVADRTGKETILSALKSELATRTDVNGTETV